MEASEATSSPNIDCEFGEAAATIDKNYGTWKTTRDATIKQIHTRRQNVKETEKTFKWYRKGSQWMETAAVVADSIVQIICIVVAKKAHDYVDMVNAIGLFSTSMVNGSTLIRQVINIVEIRKQNKALRDLKQIIKEDIDTYTPLTDTIFELYGSLVIRVTDLGGSYVRESVTMYAPSVLHEIIVNKAHAACFVNACDGDTIRNRAGREKIYDPGPKHYISLFDLGKMGLAYAQCAVVVIDFLLSHTSEDVSDVLKDEMDTLEAELEKVNKFMNNFSKRGIIIKAFEKVEEHVKDQKNETNDWLESRETTNASLRKISNDLNLNSKRAALAQVIASVGMILGLAMNVLGIILTPYAFVEGLGFTAFGIGILGMSSVTSILTRVFERYLDERWTNMGEKLIKDSEDTTKQSKFGELIEVLDSLLIWPQLIPPRQKPSRRKTVEDTITQILLPLVAVGLNGGFSVYRFYKVISFVKVTKIKENPSMAIRVIYHISAALGVIFGALIIGLEISHIYYLRKELNHGVKSFNGEKLRVRADAMERQVKVMKWITKGTS